MSKLSLILSKKSFLFLWILSLTLNIITLLILNFKPNFHGDNVGLKYNIIAGIIWYGSGKNLFSLPLAGIVLSVINFCLFIRINNSQKYLAWAITLSNLFIQIQILIAIIFLNFIN